MQLQHKKEQIFSETNFPKSDYELSIQVFWAYYKRIFVAMQTLKGNLSKKTKDMKNRLDDKQLNINFLK